MKKYDIHLASLFGVLTIAFLVLSFTNKEFLTWVFDRHHNQLSWFIRPVFIIPFCYFSYRQSWAGISFTIFCIFTSMFWFEKPEVVSDDIKTFLQYEIEWLTGKWDSKKIFMALTVPLSFLALGMAFWKKNVWFGLVVVVLIALGKILWSITSAGESGKSIIVPAMTGLLLCCVLIFLGYKRLEKNKNPGKK